MLIALAAGDRNRRTRPRAALGMLFGRAAEMLAARRRAASKARAARRRREPVIGPDPGSAAGYLRAARSGADRRASSHGSRPGAELACGAAATQAGEELPEIGPEAFTRLADDGERFYADPFLLGPAARRSSSSRSFPYATGRGGFFRRGTQPARRLGDTTHPVLEPDCHLSYPFVFARTARSG